MDRDDPFARYGAADGSGTRARAEWKHLLPTGWSCPAGNISGITTAGDDNSRLTSTILRKSPHFALKRVALVVTNKPISMDQLEELAARSNMRQVPAPIPSSDQSGLFHGDILTRVPHYTPPPLADCGGGGTGLYPTLSEHSHRRDDSEERKDDEGWCDIEKLMTGGSLHRVTTDTEPRPPRRGGAWPGERAKVYYFEVTVLSGNTTVGLIPAESVVEQAELLGSSAAAGAATKPNPFPVLLDQSPGSSLHSIGFGCRDCVLRVSGEAVGTDVSHTWESAARRGQAASWMDAIPFNREETTVGCGWEIGGRGRVFFTRNGEVVNPGREITGLEFKGRPMFPAVSIDTEGGDVIGNFGLDPNKHFKWKGCRDFVPITEHESEGSDHEDDELVSEKGLKSPSTTIPTSSLDSGTNKSSSSNPNHPPHKIIKYFSSSVFKCSSSSVSDDSVSESTEKQQRQEEQDYKTALRNSMKVSEPLLPSKIEEAKEIARELRRAADDPKTDLDALSDQYRLCKEMHLRVILALQDGEESHFDTLLKPSDLLDVTEELADEARKRRSDVLPPDN